MQRRKVNPTIRTAILGGLAVLVLLLTSCIKYEAIVKIEDDGSGTVNLLTAVDPEAFGAFGDLGDFGGSDQICDEFNADVNSTGDLPSGALVEPYNEDGFCGARVQYPLAATLDHSAALSDVLDESTRIYKEGENWYFESNFSADEITGDAEDFGVGMVDDLFEGASFQITIDLPGKAVGGANNASQIGDDGVFRWDIDLLNPPSRLFAQTEPGSGGGDGSGITATSASGDGGGLSPVVIGLIVAVILGAGALFFVMKRKNETEGSETNNLTQPGMVNPLDPTAPAGGSASMPVTDGPAIMAAPPGAAGAVTPVTDAFTETIVMNAAEAQQLSARDTVAETAGAAGAAASEATSTPQPQYDDALGAWIVDDPTRGRLRHDPATDTWNPI